MARAFNQAEQAVIRQKLMAAGRESFARYGLKRTNLEDLTEPAGIAKSTFYKFFDSKEALYVALLEADMPASLNRILSASFAAIPDLRQATAAYLRAALRERAENPLMARLVQHPQELQLLAQRVPLPELQKIKLNVLDDIRPYLEAGQARGEIVLAEIPVIWGLLQAVTILPLYQELIGPEVYPRVESLLIDLVAYGITHEMG